MEPCEAFFPGEPNICQSRDSWAEGSTKSSELFSHIFIKDQKGGEKQIISSKESVSLYNKELLSLET